jgi:O-antigen/teichoic acid export membrane protein
MGMKELHSQHLATATAWSARAVSAALQFVSIPLLIKTLGVDDYAVFVVVIGLQGWFLLADLGIGSSLQNHIAERRARDQPYHHLIAAAGIIEFGALTVLSVLWVLVTPAVAGLLFPASKGIPANAIHDALNGAGWLLMAQCGSQVITRVWLGEHRGWLSYLVPAIAQVLAMGLLVGSPTLGLTGDGKLLGSLISWLGPQALLPAACLCWRLLRLPAVQPGSLIEAMRLLLPRALSFWAFAFLGTLVLQIDYLILSHYGTSKVITEYNLISRLFGLLFFFYNAILVNAGPRITGFHARHEQVQAATLAKRLLLAGLGIVCAGTFALIFAMPTLTSLLAPGAGIHIGTTLIVCMGAYYAVRVWTDTFATLLTSRSLLRPFWISVPAQAVLTIAAMALLVPGFGSLGVVASLSIGFLAIPCWYLPMEVRRATGPGARPLP